MSIKSEYDLDISSGTANATANYFKIEPENEEQIDDIDIKFEFPYQSVQFPLSSDTQQDDEEQQNNSTGTTESLECGEHSNQIIFEPETTTNPSFLWAPVSNPKKLKKISTAICTQCNIGFPSPSHFEHHMIQIHQDDRPYPCKHCAKPFASVAQQKMHETIHDPKRFQGEPQFSCDICGNSYHLKRSLATHKLKTHLGYKTPKRPSSTPVKIHHSTRGSKNPNSYRKPREIHSCPYCDLTFPMNSHLRKHLIVHTKERPFSCHICHESFPRKPTLTNHIRNIHQSSTNPTGKSKLRPKWQVNQPCPCTICGKIFRVPSQLSKHVLLHTGEKPHPCDLCNKKFRTRNDLIYHNKQNHLKDKLAGNPLKLFKCRVCGKNDFVFFRDLRQHRYGVHRNIPYDSENEKPFACGICGKPHFLREAAIICALLGHDPGPLRKDMFKIKCPECPSEEIFGLHSVLALRRHWDKEHGDKQLPARFRIGMNGDKELKDELPFCRIDKAKREYIQMNGPDSELEKREGPLYVDLGLLEIPENERFFKRTKQKVERKKPKEEFCLICGLKVSSSSCLKRHVKVVHDPNRTNEIVYYECGACEKRFKMKGSLRNHEKKIHVNGRKVGRPNKKLIQLMKKKNVTGKARNGDAIGYLRSVNINKQGSVQAILNFQTVTVKLTRIK